MARKAFALVVCCLTLAGAPLAHAGPFGVLSAWGETPDFAPRGLMANRDVANWLMTLPQGDGSFAGNAIGQQTSTQIFGNQPIGGQAYQFMPAPSPARLAEASVARQLFDAEAMGSAPYRFLNLLAQSTIVAGNIEAGSASVEGRSASAAADSATPRAHSETCTCTHK